MMDGQKGLHLMANHIRKPPWVNHVDAVINVHDAPISRCTADTLGRKLPLHLTHAAEIDITPESGTVTQISSCLHIYIHIRVCIYICADTA